MKWADKRITYLGAAIFVLGAVVSFAVTFSDEMGGPFGPLLFIPPDFFGPIVFGIGAAVIFMSRSARKLAAPTEDEPSS